MKSILILLPVFFLLSACQNQANPQGESKDFKFYSNLINSSQGYSKTTVAENVGQYKILFTGEAKYAMRLVLFDNGVFYYQVDKLGDGEGRWEFRDGSLKLIAPRPVFDMDLEILGDKKDQKGMRVQFFDRFGFNTLGLNVREPSQLVKDKPLKAFSKTSKNL